MPQKMALQNYAINIKLFLFNSTAVKPGISKHFKIFVAIKSSLTPGS